MDPDAETSYIIIQILVLTFLTMVNAFFSGAEMALVSVNKGKVRRLVEDGNKNAKLILQVCEDSTKFLSTIQVAITFAGFFSSASAAQGLSVVIGEVLKEIGIPFAGSVAFVAITVILAYFNLVLGELVPKRMALQRAEQFSLIAVVPVYYVSKALGPFIKFLSASTNAVLRIFGMNKPSLEEEVSEEEIKALLETGSETGVFNEIEAEMINSIFSFDDKVAKEVMVPRKDIYAIDIEEPFAQYIDELLEMKHSRILVYEGDIDHIIGVLNLKDIASEARKTPYEEMDIRKLIYEPYFIHTTKKTDELFKEMQKEHQHMAVLIDEYGGTAGIVTIEDLLEEIVGEISDEYDEIEDEEFVKINDNSWKVDGGMSLEDLNDKLHLKLESENYDTVSGFIIEQLDYIPKEEERPKLEIENLVFEVEEIEEKMISKVKITMNVQ